MKVWKRRGLLILMLNITIALGLFSVCAEETTTVESTDTTSALSVSPEETTATTVSDQSRVYTITSEGRIDVEPNEVMFWEYPQLPAGQLRNGILMVKNDTQSIVSLSLSSIDLPYSNEEALLYYSFLNITVTHNGQTLYDGPYSGIADAENGLKIDGVEMNPGDVKEFRVLLRCAFNYTGAPSEAADNVTWSFKARSVASAETESAPAPAQNKDSLVALGMKIAVVVLVVLGVLLYGVQALRKKRLNKTMKH